MKFIKITNNKSCSLFIALTSYYKEDGGEGGGGGAGGVNELKGKNQNSRYS